MTPPTQCLYETLGVARTATDGEIKRAYRAKALATHPDKNRRPEAEQEFQALQHAYSVLSDAHERAWYDSHREDILRGREPGEGGVASAASATEQDLFALFAASCYRGMQGAKGFYAVYGGGFDRLWREEPSERATPVFGTGDAEWSNVRDFYREWESFSSAKTFAFADKWKLSEAENREVRRAMEKENRRERNKVKKEFNATVRELVGFVKKRDPRVIARRKQEAADRLKADEERLRRAEVRKQERADENARLKLAREEALEEDGEELDEILAGIALDEELERKQKERRKRGEIGTASEQDDDVGEGEGEGEGEDEGEDEDEERGKDSEETSIDVNGDAEDDEDEDEDEEDGMEEELYCIACRKAFRSVAQRLDHERSKKHRAAASKLKRTVLAEEAAEVELNQDMGAEGREVAEERELSEEEMSSLLQDDSKKKKKKKKRQKQKGQQQQQREEEHRASAEEPGGAEGEKAEAKEGEHAEEEKKGMSKRERRRRRQAEAGTKKEAAGDTALSHQCNTCGTTFPSRSKLMRHVNSAGHALHIPS